MTSQDSAAGLVDAGGPQPAEQQHSRGDWEAAAAAVLRKARRMSDDDPDEQVWDKLGRTTLDGISITPLGTPDLLDDLPVVDAGARPTRTGEWDIRSFTARPDVDAQKAAHEELRVDLDGGVTSVWLQTGDGSDLAALLDGVLLDIAPVVLQSTDADPLPAARALLALGETSGLHPATNLGVPADAAPSVLLEAAALAHEAGVLAFVVDATPVHDRGASDVQELAHAMAQATALLRVLTTDAGLDVAQAAGLVEFRLAATDEQFPTIAKLRAARVLWQRVQQASGAEPVPMRQHAVTGRPMMTRHDPWVNLLRTTVAAFAAGVAGAEAVTVLPFDSALGRPDAFGRRIARNTSALLISESHLARVTDPSGGAYAVERLTADVAGAAWALFARLDDGEALDPLIAATVAEREQQTATRRRAITGLTEYPNLAEQLPERESYGAWDGVEAYGASFEALRADPPSAHVFLATMGTVAAHTARATFATNLLAAGGVAVDLAGATDGVEALVAAYDGQAVVCLAGADAAYAEWGEQAASALREAGAGRVLIAGKPVDYADDSAAMGVDALAFLTRTREALS